MMPIFIQFDGIKPNELPKNRAGGANFVLMDGSVKTVNNTIGGGPRINVFSGRNYSLGDGSVKFLRDSINVSYGHKFTLTKHFEASEISIPDVSNGTIAADDTGAVSKTRLLFEAMKNMIVARGLILTLPSAGANKLSHSNNIKQLGLALHTRIAALKIIVTDGGNSRALEIELENVLITSYSLGGHGDAPSANKPLIRGSLSGEGKKVLITFCK